jgi:hypothetical protein
LVLLLLFGDIMIDVAVGLLRRIGEGPKATWGRRLDWGLPGDLGIADPDNDGEWGG